MNIRIVSTRHVSWWIIAAFAAAMTIDASPALGQLTRPLGPRRAAPRRPAEEPAPTPRLDGPSSKISADDPNLLADVPENHPLMPVLQYAVDGLRDLEKIEDYSCTMVKRERINGVVGSHQYFSCKIRHKPFSVYMYFLTPAESKGQEAIYVEGQNDGKLWAHTVGFRDRVVGTLSLDPRGKLAMIDNRYAITEIGILNLTKRLIEVGKADAQHGDCEVKITPKVKIEGRECKLIECTHPEQRREFRFHIARIYIDEELRVPVRYEAYSWPTRAGGKPVLEEEYTYLDVKLNNGFEDIDFSPRNKNYGFK